MDASHATSYWQEHWAILYWTNCAKIKHDWTLTCSEQQLAKQVHSREDIRYL